MRRIILSPCWLLLFMHANAQQAFTNSGNLKIHAGTTITFYGNMTNNGTFTDAGQNVYFSGSAAQNISGSAAITFNKVTMNNAAGVGLQRNVAVNNNLTLTTGALQLNTYTLTVDNSATSAVARTSGYIVSEQTNNSGKLKWKIDATTGTHIYPFGNSSGTYIPFVLDLTAGNIGYVTVSTYPTASNNMPYPTTPQAVTTMNNALGVDNSSNVVDRFWQIDKDGVSGTATLTFTVTAAEAGSIVNLQAQRWNSALNAWEAPLAGQTNTPNSATVPNVSSFSPWTLSGNASSLPIELLSFNAVPVNNEAVHLDWVTASEAGNDYFTVERSVDGVHFETVSNVDGAGHSNNQLSYKTTDYQPYKGVSYYRLKQTDMNGDITYSNIEAVELQTNGEIVLAVFPNPGNGRELNIGLTAAKDQEAEMVVYNALGHVCHRQTIFIADDRYMSYAASLADKLEAGVYLMTVEFNQGKEVSSKKFIVQ